MQARYEPVDLAGRHRRAGQCLPVGHRSGRAWHFTVDCPPLDEPVYLDRDMWEKVILNLLSNALKFTFDGVHHRRGCAAMTTTRWSPSPTPGSACPPREMPRLFERFHRIETDTRTVQRGQWNRVGTGQGVGRDCTAAPSPPTAPKAPAPRSPSACPSAPRTCRPTLSPSTRARVRLRRIADPYVQEALRWLPADTDPEHRGRRLDRGADARQRRIDRQHRGARLIADDNADMREYLARLLRSAGYHVDGRHRWPAGAGGRPRRAARPRGQRRDDAPAGRTGPGRGAADRPPYRGRARAAVVGARRAGSLHRRLAGRRRRLSRQTVRRRGTARPRARPTSSWRGCATTTPAGAPPLVDSLQEAFFVCDEHGAVIEINTAFTDILGYGADGLPYEPIHPWWPDADTDPEAHRLVGEAFEGLLDQTHGTFTVPVTHRDGHRLWVTVDFNHADDPDTGRRVMVGHASATSPRSTTRCNARGRAGRAQSATRTSRYGRRRLARSGRGTAPGVERTVRAGRHLPRLRRSRGAAGSGGAKCARGR